VNGYEIIRDALAWVANAATGDIGSLAARLSVAGLLLAAAVYKLRHPLIAAAAASNFGIVVHATARVGRAIGIVELVTGVLLVTWWSPATLAGCALAAVLSVGYCAVLVRALVRGQAFACHCMSSSEEAISAASVLRAAAMVVGAVAGAAGVLRGTVAAPGTEFLQACGLAAAMVGLPMAASLCRTVWRRHAQFMPGNRSGSAAARGRLLCCARPRGGSPRTTCVRSKTVPPGL
jgi:hypothetical protein